MWHTIPRAGKVQIVLLCKYCTCFQWKEDQIFHQELGYYIIITFSHMCIPIKMKILHVKNSSLVMLEK